MDKSTKEKAKQFLKDKTKVRTLENFLYFLQNITDEDMKVKVYHWFGTADWELEAIGNVSNLTINSRFIDYRVSDIGMEDGYLKIHIKST